MDEGFPAGRPVVDEIDSIANHSIHCTRHWPLSQWCARSAVVPPRPIPNRVVKRGSAEGTGGMPAGRVGPCAIHRGVEQWQLVGLITRRSMVRIHPPLPQ